MKKVFLLRKKREPTTLNLEAGLGINEFWFSLTSVAFPCTSVPPVVFTSLRLN